MIEEDLNVYTQSFANTFSLLALMIMGTTNSDALVDTFLPNATPRLLRTVFISNAVSMGFFIITLTEFTTLALHDHASVNAY